MAVTSLSRQSLYPQWLTGAGVTIIIIEVGIMCGWSSPYLARLSEPDSPLHLSPDEQAWVASLLNLGRVVGAIWGAVSTNYIGSKKTLTISILPIICCWIFTATATTYLGLYIARTLGGIAMGMAYSCFALFLGEVALPEIRGALVSLAMSGGNSFGNLIGSVGGAYLSMEISAAIFLVPCIIVALLFFWLPESPHKLVMVEDYEGAKKSIAWYQPGVDVDKEVEIIKDLVHCTKSNTFRDKIKKFNSPAIRRSLILIIVLFTFMQITGYNVILFYMETIIKRSKFVSIDSSTAVICINILAILTTALSMYLIDKCGRKFLLVLSSSGVVLSMAGLGVNSYLISINEDVTNLEWLPMTSISVFMVFFYLGLTGVPSAVLSELFPSDIKSVAGCLASLVGAIWSFLVTRLFQIMVDAIGEAYVFWINGILAFVLIPYVLICMPETKGKSFQEIQNKLMK